MGHRLEAQLFLLLIIVAAVFGQTVTDVQPVSERDSVQSVVIDDDNHHRDELLGAVSHLKDKDDDDIHDGEDEKDWELEEEDKDEDFLEEADAG